LGLKNFWELEDSEGRNLLHVISKTRNLELLNFILEQDFYKNYKVEDEGKSWEVLIAEASDENSTDIKKRKILVLEKVIMEWKANGVGATGGLFHYVVQNPQLLKFILDQEGIDNENNSALELLSEAINHVQADSIKIIIEKIQNIGGDWQGPLEDSGLNVIHCALGDRNLLLATRHGYVESVKVLLDTIDALKITNPEEYRSLISATNESGNNIASYAVELGNIELLELLSQRDDVDFTLKNNLGTSALEDLSLVILSADDGSEKDRLMNIFKISATRASSPNTLDGAEIEKLLQLYFTQATISLGYSDRKYELSNKVNYAKLKLLALAEAGLDADTEVKDVLQIISEVNFQNPEIDLKLGDQDMKLVEASFHNHVAYYLIHHNGNIPTSLSYIDGNELTLSSGNSTSSGAEVIYTIAPGKYINSEDLIDELRNLNQYNSGDITFEISAITGDGNPTFKDGDIAFQKRGNCAEKSTNILVRKIIEMNGCETEAATTLYKMSKYQAIERAVNFAAKLPEEFLNKAQFIRDLKGEILEITKDHSENKLNNPQGGDLKLSTAHRIYKVSSLDGDTP
jgi:hypothetical protein